MSAVHTSRARHISLWLPVVVYTAAIFFVSGLPDAPLPVEVSDKTGHMAAYAGLAILAVRALGGGLPCRVVWRVAWLALVIAAGYGAFDELHRSWFPADPETSRLVRGREWGCHRHWGVLAVGYDCDSL